MKSRADITGDGGEGVPDQLVDFIDIPTVVDAFLGFPYPFGMPVGCE